MPDDRDRFRSTLDHLLEGFQIIGPDWRYLYVNPVAAKHGRSTAAELEGRTMMEAYPGIDQSPLFETLKRAMDDRVPASIENQFAVADGAARWFELRIEPVPEGVVVHSIDIEDRKKVEAELHRVNQELEQRVIDRTRDLAAANRDLEAFGYTVSHDLRAPLRAIDGFGAALAEDCGELLDENGQKHLARIRAATARMSQMIEDLLMLSRMGRAAVSRTDIDLSALAHEVAAAIEHASSERPERPERRVEWRIAPNLRARADLGLTRVVMENLLGNAWKFTAATPNPVIEVRESDDKPGAIVVVDNGAGFDMTYVRSLFRPFHRLHRAQEFPGTGIGLATVHRIVEKHGGSVEARGVVGGGATIIVSFEPRGGATGDAS